MGEVYAATAAMLPFVDAVDHHSHIGEQIHIVALGVRLSRRRLSS
jgi:hypothetical protein